MPNELDPIIDQWYQRRDKGELFRVVATDSTADVVEIQDFDGAIEELDFDSWQAMDMELAEAPEDWTGPFDEVEADDLGYSDMAMSEQNWRESLDTARTTEESWQSTTPPDEIEEQEAERPLETYLEEDENSRKLAK